MLKVAPNIHWLNRVLNDRTLFSFIAVIARRLTEGKAWNVVIATQQPLPLNCRFYPKMPASLTAYLHSKQSLSNSRLVGEDGGFV